MLNLCEQHTDIGAWHIRTSLNFKITCMFFMTMLSYKYIHILIKEIAVTIILIATKGHNIAQSLVSPISQK